MNNRNHRRGLDMLVACSAITLFSLAACARDNPMSPGSHLAFGEWGGEQVQIVTADSTTSVIVGCAGGTFSGNIALDGTGHFVANGNWIRMGGAFFIDNAPVPAQMSAQVSGSSATFAIAVNDTINKQVTSVGPSTVVFGQKAKIIYCP